MYRQGVGVEKDQKQSLQWLQTAAENGSANAQYNLGLLYERGDGVPKDRKQAKEWFKKQPIKVIEKPNISFR